jgi:dipeptidyl aminopeptidase/acylaminoacyl peptidase
MINVFKHRVGDWDANPDYIASISPLHKVDAIRVPLLIGQGRNDPRVKVQESLQIVEAMKKNGKEVIYIEFPDEGHGFARPENNKAFNAAVEAFFFKHLGGRLEAAHANERKVLEKVQKS